MTGSIVWPRARLCPKDISFNPLPRTVGGASAPALSGYQQVVASSAGVWGIEYAGIAVTRPETIRLWRALQAIIEGRLTPIDVPIFVGAANMPLIDFGVAETASVTHSDGSAHGDGAKYSQSQIEVTINGTVNRGAVTMVLDATAAGAMEPGMVFSVQSRLYVIKTATPGTPDPNQVTVKVWPPARVAITSGERAEFVRPVCKARLRTDTEMDLPLQLRRIASVRVRFVEDPT